MHRISLHTVTIAILTFISINVLGQDKYVARSWPNGKPMVVYFLTSGTTNIEKEQVYYESGILDYEGHYLDGVEHGKWTYYWENGNMKSQEYYEFGLEEGTMYDFDKNGNRTVKYVYSKGVLVSKETVNSP